MTGSKTPTELEKAIAGVLLYYDLLDCPLTALEIFRYLGRGLKNRATFFEVKKALRQSPYLLAISQTQQGLYFLAGREEILDQRDGRLKSSQIKWKKLKIWAKPLACVPFLQLAAVSGSLTLNNTRPASDFDLLIIARENRLWTARILITIMFALLGKRRHGAKTKDRFCLNCYLTAKNLEIKPEAKPRNLHSAQEYGRLVLILENEAGLYQKFMAKNGWLSNFFDNYPWQNCHSAKMIKKGKLAKMLAKIGEKSLSGRIGNIIEKRLGAWQTKRIESKNKNEPTDQVYFSDECLMFHPQSKSYSLMEKYNQAAAKLGINPNP